MPTAVFYIIALAFVWVSIVAAITSFSVGKWLPTAGAFARFLLLGLFTLTVIVFAAKHGAHGLGAASYSPTARRLRRSWSACCCSTSSASSCPTARARR